MGQIFVYSKELKRVCTIEERDAALPPKPKSKIPYKFKRVVRGHWKKDKETGKLVPIDGRKEEKPKVPYIQTDEIPPTESWATDEGKVFTSKKKLLEHYKQNGMIVREPGTEMKPPEKFKSDPRELREAAAKALNDLRWGNVPMTEMEKETCHREQRAYQEFKKRQR